MSSPATEESQPKAFRTYMLTEAREDDRPRRVAASHQVEALGKLATWFAERRKSPRGGIVVLPTGGGKTFTAVRFLTTEPLSAGYKVLWLAHTHHLLEQAADAFGTPASPYPVEAAWVAEPKDTLKLRVVSGTPGHCRVHEIRATDDVVICTLPSAARALRDGHPAFREFLDAAGDKLAVVFDEAHHAPAPTYTRLVTALRESNPGLVLLGLTATPSYAQESRRGWLKKLFPQEIVHRATVAKLMASRILARPHFEQIRTHVTPTFTAREYAKWVATYQDLPESIITDLAENRDRNEFIVETYLRDRERYGRTIMFADRWFQCDYLREALRKRGVKADVVYSHVAIDRSGADARNRRTSDDNGRVLDQFRRGELDVLINVRMLTEGTDVPNVQSVFLTRQTTSQILLTQMIGRALRGPAFGGTEDAYVVSFVDEWTVPIAWAEIDRLDDGETSDAATKRVERAPVQLLSIELVRRLARELSSPSGMSAGPYLSQVPVGWYRPEFDAQVVGSEDIEQVRSLVMVLDTEKPAFERYVEFLVTEMPKDLCAKLANVEVTVDEMRALLVSWSHRFFDDREPDDARLAALLALGRHVAQTGTRPPFSLFEERKDHDLDAVARHFIRDSLGPVQLHHALQVEFDRPDRFWRSLYPAFELFARHYHGAQLRVLMGADSTPPRKPRGSPVRTEHAQPRELTEVEKRAVITRDGHRCLCCGATRRLEVDHVAPSYLGGSNDMANLQTLCHRCNGDKGINEVNFRVTSSPLRARPPFVLPVLPKNFDARDMIAWEEHIRRTLNFFYQCDAVENVVIRRRGPSSGHWEATLFPGNDDRWLMVGSLQQLREQIESARIAEGLSGPVQFTVTGARSRSR